MQARQFALPALLLCLLAASCGDDEGTNGCSTCLVTGFSATTPLLDGQWVLTETPLAARCGPLNALFPTESVLTITQDSTGYIWLGTQNGIARFDGVRFNVYDRRTTGVDIDPED